MKVTQLRDKDKTTALTTMDMETWIEKTRTEIKTQPVSVFREALRYSLPDSRCYEADKLPKILPAAEFHRTESGKQLKYYNGIVELTVGPLSGRPEIILVKQLAWEQPQTHCVFTGSSGRTVKIWVKFTRPDASLPQKREEAELFHAHAYRLEGTDTGTILTPVTRPGTQVQAGFRSVLSVTVDGDAHRTLLSGGSTLGKVATDTGRAGI